MDDDRSDRKIHALRKRACSNEDSETARAKVVLDRIANCVRESSVVEGDASAKKLRDQMVAAEPFSSDRDGSTLASEGKRLMYRLLGQFCELNASE